MSLSISKLGLVTTNVNDGQCLSFEIYMIGKLEASSNVDVCFVQNSSPNIKTYIYYFYF